jgi:hypothetical protein
MSRARFVVRSAVRVKRWRKGAEALMLRVKHTWDSQYERAVFFSDFSLGVYCTAFSFLSEGLNLL